MMMMICFFVSLLIRSSIQGKRTSSVKSIFSSVQLDLFLICVSFSVHLNKFLIDWIWSPPLTWGGGRYSDQFYYIHQCYLKIIKFEKKIPEKWRAHCKISYHHIIYFTTTTNMNCNVRNWKMSNWQMNQICLMRAYTRWTRSWTHTLGF